VGGTSIRRDPSGARGGRPRQSTEDRRPGFRPEGMYRWEGPEPTRDEQRKRERALVRELQRERQPAATSTTPARRPRPLPFAVLLRERVAAG